MSRLQSRWCSSCGFLYLVADADRDLGARTRRDFEQYGTRYGGAFSKELELGVMDVTIPQGPGAGLRARPPDLAAGDLSGSFEALHARSRSRPREPDASSTRSFGRDHAREAWLRRPNAPCEAFVFVHGYNNSFKAAAFRTAQIAYDLEFEGAAICYSWPSQGGEVLGLPSYAKDEEQVMKTDSAPDRLPEAVGGRDGGRQRRATCRTCSSDRAQHGQPRAHAGAGPHPARGR